MWFFFPQIVIHLYYVLIRVHTLQRKVNKANRNPQIVMYCNNSRHATLSKQQPLAWTSNNFPRLPASRTHSSISLWELIISLPPVSNQLFLWCVFVMTYATLSEQNPCRKYTHNTETKKGLLIRRVGYAHLSRLCKTEDHLF